MDKTSRALRRYHRSRMHARALEMVNDWYYYSPRSDKEMNRVAARVRDHMAVCSCGGCCNPRRNKWNSLKERVSLAERRAQDSYDAQILEINS